MLATYAALGFVERADLSHKHGRCYILQKSL
jgi:hypothetical protein